MDRDTYPIEASPLLLSFEFNSEGTKGIIRKKIEFKCLRSVPGVYNLCFGDLDVMNKIDDFVITGNGDSRKVLATVASSVYRFLEKYNEAMIYATGSTTARTRLYRIGISNNLSDILLQFDVYGFSGSGWELFRKNQNYTAFLIKRKDFKNFLQ